METLVQYHDAQVSFPHATFTKTLGLVGGAHSRGALIKLSASLRGRSFEGGAHSRGALIRGNTVLQNTANTETAVQYIAAAVYGIY